MNTKQTETEIIDWSSRYPLFSVFKLKDGEYVVCVKTGKYKCQQRTLFKNRYLELVVFFLSNKKQTKVGYKIIHAKKVEPEVILFPNAFFVYLTFVKEVNKQDTKPYILYKDDFIHFLSVSKTNPYNFLFIVKNKIKKKVLI